MRVAYVCTDRGVPVFGRKGSSIHVQEILRGLLKRGARVELFASRTGGPPPRDLDGIAVHRLPRTSADDPAIREQAALEANDSLRDALEGAGPFDLVYERHALFSFAGMEYAQERGIASLLEVNAPLIDEQRRYRQLLHQEEAEAAEHRAFAAASSLLAVSDGVARYLEDHPAATGRVHVVPNGVDPDRFGPHVTPSMPGTEGTWTAGFVGTLKPWHGVHTLIGAFAELHRRCGKVRLLIVGDGPQRAALETQAAATNAVESIEFTGAVEPEAIPGILASFDVAVAPYPALDDFYYSPLKIYEYMAAGCPIVAASIGQICTLLDDEVTGLLYPPGDTAALARALERLRAEPDLRGRLGAAARDAAARDHTWDATVSRIIELGGIPFSKDRSIGQEVG